jgi:hypothetical protein
MYCIISMCAGLQAVHLMSFMVFVTAWLNMADSARLEQQRGLAEQHDEFEVLNAVISK